MQGRTHMDNVYLPAYFAHEHGLSYGKAIDLIKYDCIIKIDGELWAPDSLDQKLWVPRHKVEGKSVILECPRLARTYSIVVDPGGRPPWISSEHSSQE